jgi:hypothetical protein
MVVFSSQTTSSELIRIFVQELTHSNERLGRDLLAAKEQKKKIKHN